ncbi:MAG: PQQ-binding-like beta-propeller repeat protein [Chloroflexi bacterium]|nr:PQQ-binding-like beta-propeller repeat protein [Chloroflexota bacterium]
MRLHLANKGWLLVASCWLLIVGCDGAADAVSDVAEATPVLSDAEATVPPTAAIIPTLEPTALQNSDPIALIWTYDSGNAINHPPLPVGDVVIAVPQGGPVTALDAADGELRWQYAPPERIWDRAYVSDGRSLFIGLENGKLVALDLQTGDLHWEKELGINAQTPLYVADGVLYVPTTFVGPGLTADPFGQAKLFALNPDDGQEIWVFESNNYILQTPFRLGKTVYVAGSYEADIEIDEGGPMRLYALSANDGTEKWAFESLDGYPKQLYATETAVAYIAYQDFTSGVDAQTGAALWRKDTGNWVPTLSGSGDIVYFGSANTVVHALNMTDGTAVWRFNIPEGTFNYVLGAPIPLNGSLYFLTQQGDLFALDAGNGSQLWQYPTGIIAARTNPSIANNTLFIGDADGVIYAFTIN